MTTKRILRRIIVQQPIDEVVFELMQEGWPVIVNSGDHAFLYKGKVAVARAIKAESN